VKSVDNNKNAKNSKNAKDMKDIKDMKDTKDMKDKKNTDAQGMENNRMEDDCKNNNARNMK
jgi:hypothetical protein